MGYLNDTLGRADSVLACCGASAFQRDYIRMGFFLGVRAMLAAVNKAGSMEHAEGVAFLEACEAEFHAFQIEAMEHALAVLEKIK